MLLKTAQFTDATDIKTTRKTA